MKPTFKLLIVANNCDWASWQDKITVLTNFFAPVCDLQITLTHTQFDPVPMQSVAVTNTAYESFAPNVPTLIVDENWYNTNVVPLAKGYDIVSLVLAIGQWPLQDNARGLTYQSGPAPVRIEVGADENEAVYVNGKMLFNSAVHYLEHEIMHALFYLSGSGDTTHYWDFVKGELCNAMYDIHFKPPNTTDTVSQSLLAQYIIQGYQFLLQAFKNQLMNPQTSMIDKMCLAIQQYEGYIPPGVNPSYPQGTTAWRNNNPGNLRYVGQFLATGEDARGFAIFKNYQDGYNTLRNMILNAAKGSSKVFNPTMTLVQFFGTYAPSSDSNDPNAYAVFVGKQMGVDPNVFTLSQLA